MVDTNMLRRTDMGVEVVHFTNMTTTVDESVDWNYENQ